MQTWIVLLFLLLTLIFKTVHSIDNKAIQDVTRDGQLLTGHNMRIQLQEMLHGYGAKFSQYFNENKGPTEGPVWLMSFGSIVELDERSRIKVSLGQDGAS